MARGVSKAPPNGSSRRVAPHPLPKDCQEDDTIPTASSSDDALVVVNTTTRLRSNDSSLSSEHNEDAGDVSKDGYLPAEACAAVVNKSHSPVTNRRLGDSALYPKDNLAHLCEQVPYTSPWKRRSKPTSALLPQSQDATVRVSGLNRAYDALLEICKEFKAKGQAYRSAVVNQEAMETVYLKQDYARRDLAKARPSQASNLAHQTVEALYRDVQEARATTEAAYAQWQKVSSTYDEMARQLNLAIMFTLGDPEATSYFHAHYQTSSAPAETHDAQERTVLRSHRRLREARPANHIFEVGINHSNEEWETRYLSQRRTPSGDNRAVEEELRSAKRPRRAPSHGLLD